MSNNELVVRVARTYDKTVGQSLSTIDEFEKFVHDGKAFSAEASITLTAGAIGYIIGTTGDKNVHMKNRQIFESSTAALNSLVELYEDATPSGVAVNVETFNENRNSANTAEFVIDTGRTAAGGTKLPKTNNLVSVNNQATSQSQDGEYIMKKNIVYAIKVTNNGAQTATLTFQWGWYEVE